MNLPNKLTVLRAVLIPVFLFFFFAYFIPYHYTISLFAFVIASVTDALDGHIARKHNLVTDFGKFLDPLADKALVIAALAAFVEMGAFGSIPLIIIVIREFMVSGLRLVTAGKGVVVAAGFWGKLKTAFTMGTVILILVYCVISLDFNWFGFDVSEELFFALWALIKIAVWISVILTVISGIVYLKGYWKYIDTDK